jgi:hypothetical protein
MKLQPQQPPPQQPPPADGAEALEAPEARPPTATATVESNFTVSAWPPGHSIGSLDAFIERVTSKVSPHWRHR